MAEMPGFHLFNMHVNGKTIDACDLYRVVYRIDKYGWDKPIGLRFPSEEEACNPRDILVRKEDYAVFLLNLGITESSWPYFNKRAEPLKDRIKELQEENILLKSREAALQEEIKLLSEGVVP